jgi:hypothetical protein
MDENKNKNNNLGKSQLQVEGSKYEEPLAQEHITRKIDLPVAYGKDRIVAMVRDPWWFFVYWEITANNEKSVREEMQRQGHHFEKSIIRIYDITGVKDANPKQANSYFDIDLKAMVRNWYVDIGSPGRQFCVEIGLMAKQGVFYVLARSNVIRTPRFGMSDILDTAWMLSEEEYWWLFGVSGGFGVGKSSLEMKELFQRQLKEWISSGGIGVFSLSSHMLQQKR